MKEVWHPEARLYWADAAREGGVADRSAEQFFEYMRSSTNSAAWMKRTFGRFWTMGAIQEVGCGQLLVCLMV